MDPSQMEMIIFPTNLLKSFFRSEDYHENPKIFN